jgi:hypothetical protein
MRARRRDPAEEDSSGSISASWGPGMARRRPVNYEKPGSHPRSCQIPGVGNGKWQAALGGANGSAFPAHLSLATIPGGRASRRAQLFGSDRASLSQDQELASEFARWSLAKTKPRPSRGLRRRADATLRTEPDRAESRRPRRTERSDQGNRFDRRHRWVAGVDLVAS